MSACPVSTASILGFPVFADGRHVGHVTGVLVDPEWERVFGLEVADPEGRSTFLPWIAAYFSGEAVMADSVLVLIDMGEFDGYYACRGAHVYRERSALESLLIAPDGSLAPRGPVSVAAAAGKAER